MTTDPTPALPVLAGSEAATALVRAWCEWHVAPVLTQTVTLDTPDGGAILLPSKRVVNIVRATYDGRDITDGLEWSADGMIRYPFRSKFRALTVTMEHGFDEAVIAPLIERIEGRLTTARPGVSSASETTGPLSQSITFSSGAAGAGLLSEDRDALMPYRLTWGV